MRRMTSCLFAVAVFSGILLACQEPASNTNWTTDVGGDAPSDTSVDGTGDLGVDDAGADGDGSTGPDTSDTRDQDQDTQPDGADTYSGPDCSKDTDGDRLNNCDEAELCTDPTDSDTDGDGLSDYKEVVEGTDPCKADTDEDGADDATELEAGLNPNKPDTFEDGVTDGNRWRTDACAPPADPSEDLTGTITYRSNSAADYTIGVPQQFGSFQQVGLTGVAPLVDASVFGDGSNSLYGFLISKRAEGGRIDPVETLRQEVHPEIHGLAGNNTDNLVMATHGAAFDTHDGHRATIGHYEIDTPTAKTPAKVREELLFGMDAFARSNLTGGGLPSTAGTSYSSFRIDVSVSHRTKSSGPNQVLVSMAVAPAPVVDSDPQVRFEMEDLVNTTNVSGSGASTVIQCDSIIPREKTPRANVYWVVDQSDVQGSKVPSSAGFNQTLHNQMLGTQIDMSLGITNMNPDNQGRLYSPWTQNGMQFASNIQNAGNTCTGWSCGGSIKPGLEVAYEGTRYMRVLLPETPPSAERVDDGASMVTIFMADDPAYSVASGSASLSMYRNFFTGSRADTTAFAVTGTPNCAQDGSAYRDVALATGGGAGSICSNDVSAILSDIVFSAAGELSGYVLSETPVSASLSVFTDNDQDPTKATFVPRSRDDGFDYFPEHNTVAFFGSYRPKNRQMTDYAEDFVAVRYEYLSSP